jgi:hypothetical protein
MSFLKALPRDAADRIDLTIVSPRNYFLYTPLLPAVATGTVEERSIVEPVRKVRRGRRGRREGEGGGIKAGVGATKKRKQHHPPIPPFLAPRQQGPIL